nr:transposase [Streptomyces sp. NBC_01361]
MHARATGSPTRNITGPGGSLLWLDKLATVGLWPAVLVADTGYGANADFRHVLEDRGLAYALQVKGEVTAHTETAEAYEPPYGGLGPHPLPRYHTRPLNLCEHVLAAGRDKAVTVTWRKSSRVATISRFVFSGPACGLPPQTCRQRCHRPDLADRPVPEGEDKPVKYWISNLPATSLPGTWSGSVDGISGRSDGRVPRSCWRSPSGSTGGQAIRAWLRPWSPGAGGDLHVASGRVQGGVPVPPNPGPGRLV